MERKMISREKLFYYLRQIIETMIKERCNMETATKKVGIEKKDLDHWLDGIHRMNNEEGRQLKKELETLENDYACSEKAEGRLKYGYYYNVYGSVGSLSDTYNKVVKPSLVLEGAELEEYRRKRPLLDFDKLIEWHEKEKSGEIYRTQIIKYLNRKRLDINTVEKIKSEIPTRSALQGDKEIMELLAKAEEICKKKIIDEVKKAIEKKDIKKLQDLAPKIASLQADEEIEGLLAKVEEICKEKTIDEVKKAIEKKDMKKLKDLAPKIASLQADEEIIELQRRIAELSTEKKRFRAQHIQKKKEIKAQ